MDRAHSCHSGREAGSHSIVTAGTFASNTQNELTPLPELKVLPTQPDTPPIPEEDEDDGDGEVIGEMDEGGVEVSQDIRVVLTF